MRSFILSLFICFSIHPIGYGKQWIVAEDGQDNAEGTLLDPWSKEMLAPLLYGDISQIAQAGDTIYFRGGTYYGHLDITIEGDENNKILIAPYPGERAIISGSDGTPTLSMNRSQIVWLKGSYLIFDGFEITMQMKSRWRLNAGADDRYWDGINIQSANAIVRNLIVHNVHGPGITAWSVAENTDIHTCISFHNGYESVNRPAGHNFYIQNDTGTKNMYNNILFMNFGYGIHMYTENATIKNMNFHDNTTFNCGKLGYEYESVNIFCGGKVPFDNINIDGNVSYHSEGARGNNIQLGYWTEGNTYGYITNNLVIGGDRGIHLRNEIDPIVLTGNKVYVRKPQYTYLVRGSVTEDNPDHEIKNNEYFWEGDYDGLLFGGESWDSWSQTYDKEGSVYTNSAPTADDSETIVRYYPDSKWITITVYNPGRLSAVDVDLSGILPVDSSYYIYDVEQLFEEPVKQGVYNGKLVTIPMDQDSTEVTQPIGARYSNDTDAAAGTHPLDDIKHTTSEFGVFIVKANKFVTVSDPLNVESSPNPISSFSVYPNPVSTTLYITANDPIEKLELINHAGKVLGSYTVNETSYALHVSDLEKGVYLLRAIIEKSSSIQKIVVE